MHARNIGPCIGDAGPSLDFLSAVTFRYPSVDSPITALRPNPRAKEFSRLIETALAQILGLITPEHFIGGTHSEKACVLPLRLLLRCTRFFIRMNEFYSDLNPELPVLPDSLYCPVLRQHEF